MLDRLLTSVRPRLGIQPNVDKSSTLRSRIMPTPLPDFLRISLEQFDGLTARPLVKIGDRVGRYQVIAEPRSPLGCPVHSPASGRVTAIEFLSSISAEDSTDFCIVIAVDEEQQSTPTQGIQDYRSLTPEQVVQHIAEAGIRGGGGQGFPVAHKITLGRQQQAHTLIINAVECAPYQSADEALVREYAEQIVRGCEILRFASGAERCVIAFQKGKSEALLALRNALTPSDIELHLAPSGYPAGSEQQLCTEIVGKEIPAKHYPVEHGILVFNVGVAFSVWRAIADGKPCTSRITTLAGESLRTPKNFDAPFGTPVRHLLALCGAQEKTRFSIIVGDTLRSHFLLDKESGIDVSSRCIIAAGDDEFPPLNKAQSCTRCGNCQSACVLGLQPDALMRLTERCDAPSLLDAGISSCFDCGACTYSCPASIDLASILGEGKRLVTSLAEQEDLSKTWKSRFEFHQFRRQRDKERAQENSQSSKSQAETKSFSKSQAQLDIAAAVARVKAKRQSTSATAAADEEPSAPNKEPSALNKVPSAPNREPSAPNKKPSAPNKKPSAPNKKPSAPNKEPLAQHQGTKPADE